MIRTIIASLLLTQALLAQDSAVDSLSQAQMQNIFQQLAGKSLTSPLLTEEELNRAALQGLMQRMGNGISLISKTPQEITPLKFHSEALSSTTAYLRPSTFTMAEMPQWESSLQSLAKSTTTTHLILDLRVPASPGEPDCAVRILSQFLPDATTAFSTRTASDPMLKPQVTKGPPAWNKPVIILVDAETNNIAEILAAALHHHHQALLVGTNTTGHAFEYSHQEISPTLSLRLSQTEALISTSSPIFRRGLQPDLLTPFDSSVKNAQFLQSQTSGSMKSFAFAEQRPRHNEASLLSKNNPELDYQLAKSAGIPTPWDIPPPTDPVIQQALDYVIAKQFLQTP